MADFQQFQQQYPTLSNWVGAAREAAAVTPLRMLAPGGAISSAASAAGHAVGLPTRGWDESQQRYNEIAAEREQFQQSNPGATTAGRVVGGALNAAALGGLAAAAPAAAPAAAQAGFPAALGGAAPQAASYAPTLGNALRGAAAMASPAGSALKTAANYAALPAAAVLPALAGRGNSSQAQQVDQTRPQTEVNARTLGEIGLSPITQSPRQAAAAAAAPQRLSALNMNMFAGDDYRLPFTERRMLQELSPKPHYPTGMEQMMSLGSALARKRYDAELQRATNDAQRTAAEQNFQNTIMDIIAKGMGPHAMMNAYAAQAVNPMGYGE